ncbi:MAG: hypothetical protein KC535_03290 [Nanoarchaeota archaeon]|nr:hypothetical protein [Nanoarchaeota archaeon]
MKRSTFVTLVGLALASCGPANFFQRTFHSEYFDKRNEPYFQGNDISVTNYKRGYVLRIGSLSPYWDEGYEPAGTFVDKPFTPRAIAVDFDADGVLDTLVWEGKRDAYLDSLKLSYIQPYYDQKIIRGLGAPLGKQKKQNRLLDQSLDDLE